MDNLNIPDDILKKLKNQSEVTDTEKEKLYEQAFDETTVNSQNMNRGLWAKCLVENNGDEKQTQTSYIKKRVENWVLEKNNNRFKKMQNEYLNTLQEKIEEEKFIKSIENQERIKNLKEKFLTEGKLRESAENLEGKKSHSKFIKHYYFENIKIAIFEYQLTTFYPFYWIVKLRKNNNNHEKRHFGSLKIVEEDINKYLNQLMLKNPEIISNNTPKKINIIKSEIEQGGYDFTLEDVLDFGKKLERNKTLFEDIKEILDWSTQLNKSDITNTVKFVEEKNDEHLNILMDDPFEGRKKYEEENLIKARKMIENSISKKNERNPEWFKAVLWEALLFSGSPPTGNELSELIHNWLKNNN
jgi:hypothetical protein